MDEAFHNKRILADYFELYFIFIKKLIIEKNEMGWACGAYG